MFWNTVLQPLLLAAAVAPAALAGRGLGSNGRFGLPQGRTVMPEGLGELRRRAAMQEPPLEKRASEFLFLNANTSSFAVNGSGIPDVDFDIGESYAGSLSLTDDPKDENQLFFWFFPSTNPDASKEIVIWLNGGPGCSSLEGLLQENGPFLWQYGTYKPVPNSWSWNKLSNMVYIEQPVGTGFSVGTPTATSEEDVAQQFLGFWKNFIDTFSMQGYKVYITGESYAGMYCPYIASAMLDAKDDTYYNMSGLMIYDPVIGPDEIQSNVPVVPFVDYWKGLFPLNDSFVEEIHARSASCGYDDYMNKYLTFPPSGPQPAIFAGFEPNGTAIETCEDLWYDIYTAVSISNPCFNMYQVSTTCPMLWDVLGFPGSLFYIPEGANIYFERDDVKEAIHAPKSINWTSCSNIDVFVDDIDNSLPSSFTVLPKVIDATKNVIIGHGALDYILLANGTLLSIQNMTWGGQLGFQTSPTDPLFVPFHDDPDMASWGGSGILGTVHTERGLTYAGVALSGHMVPQYQPTVAFRQLEVLLGRVSNLSSTEPFSIDKNVTEPSSDTLGKGNAPPDTTVQAASNATTSGAPSKVVVSAAAAVSAAHTGLLMGSLGLAMLMAM